MKRSFFFRFVLLGMLCLVGDVNAKATTLEELETLVNELFPNGVDAFLFPSGTDPGLYGVDEAAEAIDAYNTYLDNYGEYEDGDEFYNELYTRIQDAYTALNNSRIPFSEGYTSCSTPAMTPTPTPATLPTTMAEK